MAGKRKEWDELTDSGKAGRLFREGHCSSKKQTEEEQAAMMEERRQKQIDQYHKRKEKEGYLDEMAARAKDYRANNREHNREYMAAYMRDYRKKQAEKRKLEREAAGVTPKNKKSKVTKKG